MNIELWQRLERMLEKSGHECEEPTIVTLRYHYGEPEPAIPTDVPPCRKCGELHLVVIHEIVVTTREEAAACLAEIKAAEQESDA